MGRRDPVSGGELRDVAAQCDVAAQHDVGTACQAEQIFEALPVSCCVVDASGTVLRGNVAFAGELGTSRQRCIGQLLSGWFAAAQRGALERRLRSAIEGAPCNHYELGTFELANRSTELSLVAVRLGTGCDEPRWLVTLATVVAQSGPASEVRPRRHDALGARELEDVAPTLEANGALVSSLAHDLGNLLQGVGGCLNLALGDTASGPRARKFTQQALDAVRGGTQLVTALARLGRDKGGWAKAVELAAHRPQLPAPAADPPPPQPAPRFTGRVLLVEDDWRVRIGIRYYLQQLGFEVIEAGDVGEALSRADGTVGLLVTDVVLPEVSGPHIRRLLREEHPELKAVYISAHPARYLIDRGLLETNDVLLQKPFDLQEFAFRLAQVCTPAQAAAPAARAVG
jgi:CheY-like chemotaxis protein